MSIRLAKIKDTERIMQFISKYWKQKHVLSINKKLFLYFYKKNSKYLNFIVYEQKNQIFSILGFIDYGKYNSLKNNNLWLALWISNNNIIGSGLRVLNFLINKNPKKNILGLGLTTNAIKILEKFNFETGKMNHYYMVNEKIIKTKIIKNYIFKKKSKHFENKLIKYNKLNLKDLNKIKNYLNKSSKNFFFLKRKYFNNDYYSYDLYEIFMQSNRNKKLIVVLRKIRKFQTNILRIVDMSGDFSFLQHIHLFLKKILTFYNAEYIDLVNYGLDKKIINQLGFSKLNYNSKIIVPNMFEPLVYKNKILNFAILNQSKTSKKYNIFKADGDQERPNKIIFE